MRPVIHVIDDDKDSADLLTMVLGLRLPYAMVQAAYGGTAALALALRQPPHVAVLDLEMPGLDGETVARSLKAAFPVSAPLLIALSGNVERLATLDAGDAFDHRMTKPVDLAFLVRLLAEHLARFTIDPVP